MLKVTKVSDLDEGLQLKRTKDKFDNNRVVVVSDNPNPQDAKNETYQTRDILGKHKAYWNKAENYWQLDDKFMDKSKIFDLATSAVKQANMVLRADTSGHKNIEQFSDIEELTQIKEYLVMIRGVIQQVKSISSNASFAILDQYVTELGESLDNQKLLDDIAAWNKARMQYKIESGDYTYSPGNQFLIWLQASAGAKYFGSKPYWLGRGYEPKPDAHPISILQSVDVTPLWKTVVNIITAHPDSPMRFSKASGVQLQTGKYQIPTEKHQAFFAWAKEKGLVPITKSRSFQSVDIYDDQNVQPIEGREQSNPPEGPKWFDDNEAPDDKAEVIIESLRHFIADLGITVEQGEHGGARGVSYGGKIKLLHTSPTIDALRSLAHELGHELGHEIMHQPENYQDPKRAAMLDNGRYLTNKDRQMSSEDKELQADSLAYMIMKSFGFPVEYNVNYLAGWKANKRSIETNQKLLRDVSAFVMKQINKYAPDSGDQGQSESGEDVDRQPLQESVNRIKDIIIKTNKF